MTNLPVPMLTESLEDYLEAIYCIIQEKQVARPKDIAKHMNVTNASVTGALRTLAERSLIHYEPYEFVTFTELGEKMALAIYRHHTQLKTFLTDILKIDASQADEIACKMEHVIPDAIIEKLVRFVSFAKNCPQMNSFDFLNDDFDRELSSQECQHCPARFDTRKSNNAKNPKKNVVM